MKKIKLWWIRIFVVLTREEAKSLGLTPYINIYGDQINLRGCRSIWIDDRQRTYRVGSLSDN